MGDILDRIEQPSDLKALDQRQLKALAQEIRDTIIRVITVTGGHLASNLGVVELTVGPVLDLRAEGHSDFHVFNIRRRSSSRAE